MDDVIEEWFVCFKSTEHKHWIQRFLKKEFTHCYAFKESPGGQFLILVEPMRSHLDIDILPKNDENLSIMKKCNKMVRVIVKYDLKKDRGHFCRFNCVEVVKSLIGIKSFFIFTPYQLYKELSNDSTRETI